LRQDFGSLFACCFSLFLDFLATKFDLIISLLFHAPFLGNAQMQSYEHDTDQSSLRAKGKGKAISTVGEPAPPQLPSFPKHAVPSRPRISRNTFSRPQDPLGGSQTAGNLGTSQDRDSAVYRSSTTWTSSSGDFGVNCEDEEVEDRRFFVDEYNKLAKKVCRQFHRSLCDLG
jgi:hypothetical protein